MEAKIIIHTPKGQARRCINSHKLMITGIKYSMRIKEMKIDSDEQFHYTIDIQPDELPDLQKRAAKYEANIRRTYQSMFTTIYRCNYLMKKFDNGALWAKRWLISRYRKLNPDETENPMLKDIQDMDSDQIKDYLNITDKEYMMQFLQGTLIEIKTR